MTFDIDVAGCEVLIHLVGAVCAVVYVDEAAVIVDRNCGSDIARHVCLFGAVEYVRTVFGTCCPDVVEGEVPVVDLGIELLLIGQGGWVAYDNSVGEVGIAF